MDAEASAAIGFAVALVATSFATPLAIRVARRVNFYDHPHDYHRHARSTPLLGGTAIVAGVLAAVVVLGVSGKLVVLIGCALAVWLIGTLDDWRPVGPGFRVLSETAAALVLVAIGLGWKTKGGAALDIPLTVLWVVGLVNGFNLMDNLDGACGTVACVSVAGIGTLALIAGAPMLAGLSFALAGACLGFLHWNLSRPAQIFLGDGGSMPIGMLVAGLAMATTRRFNADDAYVVPAALMVGVVTLDITLVTVSRARRGVTLLTGGRDHLTHRLLPACGSPQAVAVVLAITQAALCAVALATRTWSDADKGIVVLVAVSLGTIAIVVLDNPRWRPAGIAVGAESVAHSGSSPVLLQTDQR
jgi:UDP-GlcNAc:undecaprenyl-phosphate GlcNAc-1-phosphate transferase